MTDRAQGPGWLLLFGFAVLLLLAVVVSAFSGGDVGRVVNAAKEVVGFVVGIAVVVAILWTIRSLAGG